MFKQILGSLAVLAAGLTQVAAQSNYPNTSLPFNLVIESSNSTLNGSALQSCHSGAAIEVLCITSGGGASYNFNTSQYSSSPGYPVTGILTWVLRGSGFNVSEPMTFSIDPASNVALPMLEPTSTEAQLITFTTNSTGPTQSGDGGYMAVAQYIDDSVSPASTRQGTLLQRWAICQTYSSGYRYTTLAWILGSGPAQNPSCQSVKVKRVFL